MHVNVSRQGAAAVLRLQGELTEQNQGGWVDTATNLLSTRGARLVVDLAAVPFVNSTGIGDLVRVNSQANVQECRVILAAPSPFVEGVLQTTRLDKFFEVCPTVEAALARFQAPA